MSFGLSRCECHDCTQARAAERRGTLGGAVQSNSLANPPICQKHNAVMSLNFYERPFGSLGNGWVCASCVKERAATP